MRPWRTLKPRQPPPPPPPPLPPLPPISAVSRGSLQPYVLGTAARCSRALQRDVYDAALCTMCQESLEWIDSQPPDWGRRGWFSSLVEGRDDCGFRPVLLSTGMADVGLVTELNRDATSSTNSMTDVGSLTDSSPSIRPEHAGRADDAAAGVADAAAAVPADPLIAKLATDPPSPAATGLDCASSPAGVSVESLPELAAEWPSSAAEQTDSTDADAAAAAAPLDPLSSTSAAPAPTPATDGLDYGEGSSACLREMPSSAAERLSAALLVFSTTDDETPAAFDEAHAAASENAPPATTATATATPVAAATPPLPAVSKLPRSPSASNPICGAHHVHVHVAHVTSTSQAADWSSGDLSSSLSTVNSHAGDWSSGLSFDARAAPTDAALAPPAPPASELPQGRVRQLTAPPQPPAEAAPGSSHELGLRQESLPTLEVGGGIAEGAETRLGPPSAAMSSSSLLANSPGALPPPSPSLSTMDADTWLAARGSLRPPLSHNSSYSPHPRLFQRGSSLRSSGGIELAGTLPQPGFLSRDNSRPAVELGDFDEAEEAALLRHTHQTLAGDKDVPLPPEGLHVRPEAFYEATSHGAFVLTLALALAPTLSLTL